MVKGTLAGFSVDNLKVETADGKNVKLLEGFTYITLSGIVINVAPSEESDGGSTPQIIWNLIPPTGDWWMAAFLHDHLYRNTNFKRSFCDDTILEAMKRLGVNRFKAYLIYWNLRMFGWHAFNEDRRAK